MPPGRTTRLLSPSIRALTTKLLTGPSARRSRLAIASFALPIRSFSAFASSRFFARIATALAASNSVIRSLLAFIMAAR
jgi:hypothetical protein